MKITEGNKYFASVKSPSQNLVTDGHAQNQIFSSSISVENKYSDWRSGQLSASPDCCAPTSSIISAQHRALVLTGSIASKMNDNYKVLPTDLLEQTRSEPSTSSLQRQINNWERHRVRSWETIIYGVTGDLHSTHPQRQIGHSSPPREVSFN